MALDQQAYEQRGRDYEKVLEDSPQKLLEGNLQQFRLLAEERPTFGLSVPDAWSTDWQRLADQGDLLEPARQNPATQRSQIARRRDAVALPPVDLELLQRRLGELDTEIKRIAGEKDSMTADNAEAGRHTGESRFVSSTRARRGKLREGAGRTEGGRTGSGIDQSFVVDF